MTLYIFKIILCSALFLFVYKALLENERMHFFNRFYLIIAVALSFLIPFISFSQNVNLIPGLEETIYQLHVFPNQANINNGTAPEEINYQFRIIVSIYLIITLLLLFRFFKNLLQLLQTAKTSAAIFFKDYKIILIEKHITPHSFLDNIFISKEDFKDGNIKKEILLHELTHVQQKHSWDIIFIEILQIIFWFNPIIFLYRKAILLNHEFLADEKVLNTFHEVYTYQQLLLQKAGSQSTTYLTSRFNYSITKKRLQMMTKSKSFRNALGRQLALIPILAISIFFFSTKTNAQDTGKVVNPQKNEVISTIEGISSTELVEYESIVDNAKNEKGKLVYTKFSEADKKILEKLFLLMSKEQQAKQIVIFYPAPPPLPKSIPTEKQIDSWKNDKTYGLWINGKRVKNSILNSHSNIDFSQVFVSKLDKNAINYGKHYYQVDLMTNDYYSSYYKHTIESKQKYFMGIRMKKK